jgi:hypothetical protein
MAGSLAGEAGLAKGLDVARPNADTLGRSSMIYYHIAYD